MISRHAIQVAALAVCVRQPHCRVPERQSRVRRSSSYYYPTSPYYTWTCWDPYNQRYYASSVECAQRTQ